MGNTFCTRYSLLMTTRIIGIYTVCNSILLITMMTTNFFSSEGDDKFFESIEKWCLLGLNWMQLMKYSQLHGKAQLVIMCFLVYIVLFLLAGAYLILGSFSRKNECAIPWMYMQTISIIDQTVALALRLSASEQSSVFVKNVHYKETSSTYLVLSVCFWMVVKTIKKIWFDEQEYDLVNHDPTSLTSASMPNSNGVKSPSFLSQNFASRRDHCNSI